jgi:ubiquinol-cytochrome c reductase cytochrome b subunit
MAGFVVDNLKELDDADKNRLQTVIAALSAEAALPAQAEAEKAAEADGTLAKGRRAMGDAFESSSCVDCHKFRDQGDLGSAPDLTGWGSKEWLGRFISDPTHEAFYRETNDRMPSFGRGPEGGTKKPLLTADEIDLVARWLRGEMK